MHTRIKVFVYASDTITQAGVASQLVGRPEVELVDSAKVDEAKVAIVSTDRLDDTTIRVLRALQRNGCPRVVLVAAEIDEADVLVAVEAGVVGLLRRQSATAEQMVGAVRSAVAGDGTLPPDLLGRLLRQVQKVQTHVLGPRGLSFSGLSERELAVLKLVAEGHDTRAIAKELAYSERTIKNIIQDVTNRFGLRNRSHAVAYALRQGLI